MSEELKDEREQLPPIVDMEDKELRQLAVDIVDGRVFGTWNIPEDELKGLLASVFMPLIFIKERLPENLGHIYEYLSEAGERAINGYPMFMSMRFLSKDDTNKIKPLCAQLEQQKQEFLNQGEAACPTNPTPPMTDGPDGEISTPLT